MKLPQILRRLFKTDRRDNPEHREFCERVNELDAIVEDVIQRLTSKRQEGSAGD